MNFRKRLASNSIGPMRREVGSFLNTAKYSWSRMKEITGQNDLGYFQSLKPFYKAIFRHNASRVERIGSWKLCTLSITQ